MSCCTPKGQCSQAVNCETRGSYQPRYVTVDPIGEPRRVIMLDAEPIERRSAHRGPQSCQAHGICQGRYPHCGQCDDPHPEDEPPTPTPFDQMHAWLISAAIAFAVVCVVGVLALAAGATVHAIVQVLP